MECVVISDEVTIQLMIYHRGINHSHCHHVYGRGSGINLSKGKYVYCYCETTYDEITLGEFFCDFMTIASCSHGMLW